MTLLSTSNSVKISSVAANLSNIIASLSSNQETTAKLHQRTGYQCAFTVGELAKDGPTPGTIIFSNVLTNIGGNWSVHVHLQRGLCVLLEPLQERTSGANCIIKRNGTIIGFVNSYPGTSNTDGYHEASTFAAVYLTAGDFVYLDWLTANLLILIKTNYNRISGRLKLWI